MKELFKAVLKNSCGALFHVVAGCIVAIPSISMGLLLCQAETAWLPRCSTPHFEGGAATVFAVLMWEGCSTPHFEGFSQL